MDEIGNQGMTQDVTQIAEALGKITQDETTFRLLVESFRAQDYEEFRELLSRFDLLERCHLVCHWLCSKECALICLDLCGPPPKDLTPIDLREFGELTAKITANHEVLARLVGAVTERDEKTFQAVSYTHLDVYKRQGHAFVTYRRRPS